MPKVKVNPSGKTFVAHTYESVLQAGLNAGVALEYGCSNGNCGECTARLISGEICKIRHHDFVLSEQEKLSGHFPMCCYQAESDLVIEAIEASGVADIPLQKIKVRVKKIEQLNEQIIQLHLRTPRSNRLRFMAGQSVKLGGEGIPDGIYQVASCPCDDMNLYFHIPNIPGDGFSEYVFEGGLAKSDELDLRGPKGRFVLGADIARPLLLISWHTGFASMQSLIEHAIAVETEKDVYLYRLSPIANDHYLDNLCRAWADAFDNINYTPLPDRYTLMSEAVEGEETLRNIVRRHDDILNMEVYVAAPPSLTESAKKLFRELGLQENQVHLEPIALGFYDI